MAKDTDKKDTDKKVPPVADRLVHYARKAEWQLFVDQHGEAHTLSAEGRAIPIARANRLLTELLYEHEERAPTNDGLIGARRVLDMLAHKSGDVRELHTRSAFHDGAVYYELAPGRVVRIDERGWELNPKLKSKQRVYFRDVKNLKPLPDPVRDGTLDDLAALVRLKTPRDRRLFLTYVTLVALAHIPRPIWEATGVMGAGKTTASRVVKRLLDPTGNEAVTIDKRDFLQKAAHCFILLLDNQNSLPEWFQDTLCRLVTGESDSKRVLYSDDEDHIWSMKRAVLLNGINPPSDRGDVQDRTLPIELERIDNRKRKPEDDFWEDFEEKHPKLLGAVFDALSGALRERDSVTLDERPRLADWGLYAAALYKSQEWGVDQFKRDWKEVEKTQQQGTLDGSIVAQAVILYMKDREEKVELPPGKLHAALEARGENELDLREDKTWPKTSRTLWKKIREVTPLLEAHGIRAWRDPSGKSGRPIVLDPDFSDDPEGSPEGEDNPPPGDGNFELSSPQNPHWNGSGGDNASGGRYFRTTLGSHTLIKKDEEREGERNPKLLSPSSPADDPAADEYWAEINLGDEEGVF